MLCFQDGETERKRAALDPTPNIYVFFVQNQYNSHWGRPPDANMAQQIVPKTVSIKITIFYEYVFEMILIPVDFRLILSRAAIEH